jgi:hypothetical protein
MGNIFQVIAVLDASQVREIRWRVKSGKDANARARLHKTIASRALLAFAPALFWRQKLRNTFRKWQKIQGSRSSV